MDAARGAGGHARGVQVSFRILVSGLDRDRADSGGNAGEPAGQSRSAFEEGGPAPAAPEERAEIGGGLCEVRGSAVRTEHLSGLRSQSWALLRDGFGRRE